MKLEIIARPNTDPRGPYGRTAKGRMFVEHKGETLVENLGARLNRDHRFYRRAIVPAVRKHLRLPDEVKFTWTQMAGCTRCPCSPGFVLEGVVGTSIWVTLTDDGNPELVVVDG